MNIRIEMPEILIACSALLFSTGGTLYGWIFFSLGILGATLRLGLKLQEQQQQAEAVKEGVDVLKGSADDFLKILNDALAGKKKSGRTDLN